MAARLILVRGEGSAEYAIGAFNTIGRHPENTVQVLDRIVSKEHCRITRSATGEYMLRDAGSLNGTYVNGERITECVLARGDEISLGNTVLRFEVEEEAPAPRMPNVTIMPGQLQSQVRSRVDANTRFIPATQIATLEALQADYEKLRIAHELSQKLSVTTDLDELLQKIVEESFELIRADRAVILLYDPDTDELVPRYVKQRRDGGEIQLSTSILDEVKSHKQAVLSSDAMFDERFKSSKSIIMQGIRSTMCVPLLYADRIVGAMHVDSLASTGAFSEKDLTLFQGIATQAAIAIENHRLAKKIEREASTRAQFQRLLSPNLVEQIVSGALALDQQGSQREVTMLFSDIRGFTAMSERHPPEEMVATLNEYFEVMVDVLFGHRGTLDKYVGDEIIGLFGAPVTLPDAPEQAIRCALAMLSALDELNRIRHAKGKDVIHIGIGVNTGPVIAGAIGSSQTLQYTVIGDAVNIASRLCSVAEANEVLISQSTLDRVRGLFEVVERPAMQLKGKSQPLPIYQVLRMTEGSSPSRATQSAFAKT